MKTRDFMSDTNVNEAENWSDDNGVRIFSLETTNDSDANLRWMSRF